MKKFFLFLKKYSFFIGLAIFPLIILRLDLFKLVTILSKINYLYLVLASFLVFPLLIIKAYRWNYLKKKQKIYYNIKESILMYGVGWYMGMFTPGKLGDLIKVIYLKNDRHSLGKSLTNVILDRIFDIIFLLIFGYLGMLFFLRFFQEQIILLSIIILIGVLFLLLLVKGKLYQTLIRYLLNFFIPTKYQKSWKLGLQDFILGIKIYKIKDYIYCFIMTAISWSIYYLIAYFLAKGIGIREIPFFYFIIAVTISALIVVIPVSISGLGTREAALIFLFSFFAISQELTVTFSLLMLSMSLLSAFIGLICWFIKPINVSSN